MKLKPKQREFLRHLGLAVKNFELVSSSCSNWSFKNKKTGAILNYRY
ncbi:hypothetical protein KYB31_15470 [Clostridium felsineum]|nr:hypothetical protein [Clostridium felsineum]MCR3760376.1 hypothetical protein [Clostridium felsineum]